MTETTPKGFLSALFDLSFSELITTKIIKLLYILGICIAGGSALIGGIIGLLQGGVGVLSLIVAPLVFLVWVISLRIYLELVMVIFKIAENTEIMAKRQPGA